jgi:hypothetical protein
MDGITKATIVPEATMVPEATLLFKVNVKTL